jgi:WD40 repeat protein
MSIFSIAGSVVVKPLYSIDVEGNVVEFVHKDNILYVATDAGKLEIYDWKKKRLLDKIEFKEIHDFLGDPISPKVFGVDVNRNGDRLIVMVQDEGGERILYQYKDKKLTKLLDKNAHIQMREARFIDNDHILIASMSNELILFQISDRKILYKIKLSLSTFSDFQLSEDHSKVASTCESGIVYVVDTHSGKVLKTYEGGNKDNVFKVDYKNSYVLACGQDRKAVLYGPNSGIKAVYNTQFLVYAGALNRDASLSALCIDEENNIGIYDNITKSLKYRLVGQHSTLNTIVFVDDKTLISSSDDNHILIWRIK